MPIYEYKVVPAPRAAAKEKGVKTTEGRFALTLARVMNDLGSEGWEYVRAETLPCDERRGLTGRVETTQHVLVFRRERAAQPARAATLTASPGLPAGDKTPRLVLDTSRKDPA